MQERSCLLSVYHGCLSMYRCWHVVWQMVFCLCWIVSRCLQAVDIIGCLHVACKSCDMAHARSHVAVCSLHPCMLLLLTAERGLCIGSYSGLFVSDPRGKNM